MIIVHETFICKPGHASKLAKLLKEVMGTLPEFENILTDLTGEFNRVLLATRFDSLAAFEQRFERYMQNEEEAKKMKEKMQGYQDMFLTGTREIFQVW